MLQTSTTYMSLYKIPQLFLRVVLAKNKNKYRIEISVTTLSLFLVTGKHDKKNLAFAMLDVLVNQNFMGRKISFLSNFSLILNSNKRKLISDIYKT